MTWCTREEAARRAGVTPEYVGRLVDLGVLAPERPDRFSEGDVRRVLTARSLEEAGIRLDEVVAAVERGALSLDFLDAAAYERFGALAPETFQQVSERTGIPLELLTVIRESIGMTEPSPDDHLREDEMDVVPFVELLVKLGFRHSAIERLIRVAGDSVRRITEEEGAWWISEVIEPAMAAGKGPEAVAAPELADRTTPLAERALLGLYHAQQARAWTANLIEAFEVMMAEAGIHSRLERLPAMCFLDLVGFTRLTEERGDDAAADLASTVSLLVGRITVQHGGKPVKWLGDGVMLRFGDASLGVRAALRIVDELAAECLPPAHVGLHAGPILYQEGDYFGQTVNLSSRIADYARSGEVLVTRAVVDACREPGIGFDAIGLVELKGVSGRMELLRARAE